jgi:hypothetical protein
MKLYVVFNKYYGACVPLGFTTSEETAKEEKATMVTIKTSYPRVKKWYEKCGFTVYHELRGYDHSRIVWSLIQRL